MPAFHKTRPPALVLLAALLAVMALTLMAWPEKAAARQEGPYAGIDQCAACHEEAVAAFRQTVHGQKGFEMRSSHACETCHGPGKAHVDAGGGKGSMTTVKGLSKDKQAAMCLTCHERGNQTEWHGSLHESRAWRARTAIPFTARPRTRPCSKSRKRICASPAISRKNRSSSGPPITLSAKA
jgi:hypothetical protein